MSPASKQILDTLRTDILQLQGFRTCRNATLDMGLGPMTHAFPNASFPIGAVHEFLTTATEDIAPTSGFIAALSSSIMRNNNGVILWISPSQILYPPALKNFGIEPDHVIFLNVHKEKEALWAMNEALKCNALSAVVAHLHGIDFKTSRRLQLAVEQSAVTGFIIRSHCKNAGTTACVSRWRISSLISESDTDLPGVGFPKWKVELLRIRNGKPGSWNFAWVNGKLVADYNFPSVDIEEEKKAG
jgi:protein ImuA